MNRRKRYLSALLMFATFFVYLPIAADTLDEKLVVPEANVTQILTLNNGSRIVGRISSVGPTEIKFDSDMGVVTIQKSRIRDIQVADASDFRSGQYWFPNPNDTRMLFGPTGRTLKQGRGYFYDVWIFFPGVAYGITDNITIGGGMTIFPGVDAKEQLFYVTPKIGFSPMKNLDAAANLMLIRVPFDDDEAQAINDTLPEHLHVDEKLAQVVGLLFFTGTYGNKHSHVTFGAGFGVADESISDNPALTLGFEHRLFRRMSIISENWLFPEVEEPLVSGGLRFFGESVAVDLALVTAFHEDVPLIPYLDFVWNF